MGRQQNNRLPDARCARADTAWRVVNAQGSVGAASRADAEAGNAVPAWLARDACSYMRVVDRCPKGEMKVGCLSRERTLEKLL